MIKFWSIRSPQERLLISVAVLIFLLLLISVAIVRPLRVAQSEALTNVIAASSTFELVDRAAQSASVKTKENPGLSDVELRTALVDLARRRGIEISRLQTRDDGHITLQIEMAPATLVFAWLLEVEQNYNAVPVRASISEAELGTVRASVEFAGGQP